MTKISFPATSTHCYVSAVERETLAFGTHMTSASAKSPLNRFDKMMMLTLVLIYFGAHMSDPSFAWGPLLGS